MPIQTSVFKLDKCSYFISLMSVFPLSSCDITMCYFIFGNKTTWHEVKGIRFFFYKILFQNCVPFFTPILFSSLPLRCFSERFSTITTALVA